MSDKATVIPMEDFEETMTNATPDELKQVSAWLQECGRVDAQTCVVDDYGLPISFDKPSFPLEVKKAGSAAAGTVTTEPGSAETVTSTPVKPGDDIIQRARELALESAVKSPAQSVFDREAYWIGSNFHRNRALDMSGAEMLRKTLAVYDTEVMLPDEDKRADNIVAKALREKFGFREDGVMSAIVRFMLLYGPEPKPRSWRYPSEAPNVKGLPKVSWLDLSVPTFNRCDLNAPKRLALSMGVSYHEAMMRAVSWYSSKERQAFEVWCSIGLSVVTGPWEERHEAD